MPSAESKELYLARSLGELNKLTQLQDIKISKNANPKTWVNTAEKVFKKASEYDLSGDEENSYVLYVRFFNIVQEVMKTTAYQKDKKFYNNLIGRTALHKSIERAETLSESLTERYKKLEEEINAAAIEKEKQAKEREKNDKTNSTNGNGAASNMLQDIDDLLNGKKISSQSSADVYKKLHVNHFSILSPSDKNPDEKDVLSPLPVKSILSPKIDPVALYGLLNNTVNNVLVLDTRSKKDFDSSHINYPCCINIPDDLLKESVSVGSIERKLPKSTWNQWIERGSKSQIVILDRNTKFEDIKADSKVKCLKDAIYLYDTSFTLKSEPVFLDGGYESWLWHYPSLVTNPKLPEIVPSVNKTEFSLDSLSYPDLPMLTEPTGANGTKNDPALTNQNAPASTPPSEAGTIQQNPHMPQTTISQSAPSAIRSAAHATLASNENTFRISNSDIRVPKVPVTEPSPPNTSIQRQQQQRQLQQQQQQLQLQQQQQQQQQQLQLQQQQQQRQLQQQQQYRQQQQPQLQGIAQTPQGLGLQPQPGHTYAPVTSAHGVTPNHGQVPTKQATSHSESNVRNNPASNQSQNTTSPTPISSANRIASDISPARGTTVSLVPSTIISPQRPQPTGMVSPQPPSIVRGQTPSSSRPQTPSSTLPVVHPQPSISSHQLRPNVSGILPKMATRNPAAQNILPNATPSVPLNPEKSTPNLSNTASIPQTINPSIPNVPQTFTSTRTGLTHGLPPGWERVLDRRTGRYYFQDHNTRTTHWNPPESLTQTMNQSIMGHNTPTVKETEPKKPSLKRSLSSPNLAKIDTDEVNRSTPKSVPTRPVINRRTKPLTESQLANLDPNHGGQGKALTGFRNLGNSCYMNSVLQCLLATAPLAKYILDSVYVEDINKTNPLGTGGRIAEELAVLTRVAHSGNYRSVSPFDFKRTIGRFAPEFGGTKQQDSQEFLLVLLDQFHEDTNRVIKKAYIEEKSNDGLPDSVAANISWENHKKRNQSIIVELFQGQFKSTLTCSVCNKQSVTFEAFMSLTLPIPTNASCQIEDCIRLFTTREKVSKDNKWFCPRCKQHREAWKTMEIWRLPPILIVHFNRFKRDYDGSWLEKRQTNVYFPSTKLDLSKFVLGPKKTLRYNLYGVSNHYGSMQSGHYTAFCRNIYDGKWYKFDDSDVTSMSESSVKVQTRELRIYLE